MHTIEGQVFVCGGLEWFSVVYPCALEQAAAGFQLITVSGGGLELYGYVAVESIGP